MINICLNKIEILKETKNRKYILALLKFNSIFLLIFVFEKYDELGENINN